MAEDIAARVAERCTRRELQHDSSRRFRAVEYAILSHVEIRTSRSRLANLGSLREGVTYRVLAVRLHRCDARQRFLPRICHAQCPTGL